MAQSRWLASGELCSARESSFVLLGFPPQRSLQTLRHSKNAQRGLRARAEVRASENESPPPDDPAASEGLPSISTLPPLADHCSMRPQVDLPPCPTDRGVAGDYRRSSIRRLPTGRLS